jgi:starch synthase
LVGIVNGIDDAVWDPAHDKLIVANYDAERLEGKRLCKRTLQRELGLTESDDAMLVGVVSRLTHQKGLDLLVQALGMLGLGTGDAPPMQFAILGAGERELEQAFVDAAKRLPGVVAFRTGYDEPLAHRIVAGADVIAVPSRFEPCGLTQLYGLRYGTLPLVRRVGGLADTVADMADFGSPVGTGFVFERIGADALVQALQRAADCFRGAETWGAMMRRAMLQDVSWREPARQYATLYEEAVQGRRKGFATTSARSEAGR